MARTTGKDTQRIAKLLARAGVASRREIERMIGEGRIALNGVAVETPATLLPSLRGVTVDGQPVKEPTPARLFLFHKPVGLLTAARDPRGRPTIYDRLPKGLPRLMPVGRLDLNTEGLLLLTTDGELKRQLELPSTGVERSYRARAYGQVSQEQLEELIEGVEIDGIRYGAIDANLERRTGANVWIELTLTEGKNREVRRVLEHLGLKVGRLIRTRYGPFVLGDLPAGAVGEVRQHDLVAFRQSLTKGKGKDQAAVMVEPIIPAAPETAGNDAKPDAGRKPTARPRPRPTPDRNPSPKPRRTAKPAKMESRPHGNDESKDAQVEHSTRSPRPPRRKAGWAKPKPKSGPKAGPRRK
ncbi:rRNA pseudouridine synthase [Sphingomonas cannabina]|uniref:pseudouridine synthase n=1 Tax=Sphingomonas cannabina TaxID=2899123 RepID=UPI001F36B957|nr:pseudouridine synthase [Sphingomonas cannabina]UIJ47286.1 rRNA pseudouridine synthase [Sphingomonas cannabina]